MGHILPLPLVGHIPPLTLVVRILPLVVHMPLREAHIPLDVGRNQVHKHLLKADTHHMFTLESLVFPQTLLVPSHLPEACTFPL